VYRTRGPVGKETDAIMSRLLHFVSETFGRRTRRGFSRPGVTSAWPTENHDPLLGYVKVLEDARRSRFGRPSRF
jgi:hypothetical protein